MKWGSFEGGLNRGREINRGFTVYIDIFRKWAYLERHTYKALLTTTILKPVFCLKIAITKMTQSVIYAGPATLNKSSAVAVVGRFHWFKQNILNIIERKEWSEILRHSNRDNFICNAISQRRSNTNPANRSLMYAYILNWRRLLTCSIDPHKKKKRIKEKIV